MITILLAALLNVFSLAPSPPGLNSTFALNGFTTDSSGIRTVSTTAPTLNRLPGGDAIDFSFVSPVSGVCIVVDVVTMDGNSVFIPIGKSPMDKNATAIVELPLPADEDVIAAGATPNGYNVIIGCDPTTDVDGSKIVFSNLYHINSQPTVTAQGTHA
jgi:hypothetical protein